MEEEITLWKTKDDNEKGESCLKSFVQYAIIGAPSNI